MSGTLLVVADTDSYVKWGAALASQLPTDAWRMRLVVLATPAQPSARQLRVALAGSRFVPTDVDVVELDALGELVGGLGPEAVLLALRGPLVRVVAPVIGASGDRPVLVSGFPGLTIPAEPKAVIYREQVDLIVLHSRREVREFRVNAEDLGVPVDLGLATLPFLRTAVRQHAGAGVAGGAARRSRAARSPRHPARRDSTPAAPTWCSPRRRRSRRSARIGCASSGGSRMPHAGVRSAGWS